MPSRVCVVIPTKDEAATIGGVIESLRGEIRRLGHELCGIMVADDSRDETRRIVERMGGTVVIGEDKGLGFAMWKGLKASLSTMPDVVLTVDGDGQAELGEIERFLAPILKGDADLVLGSRFRETGLIKYRYGLMNRIGIFILVRILRRLTHLPLTDSHGGVRAMRPEVVRELEMIGSHTYVQETIIDAHEKGFRIVEISSAWQPRSSGRSRVVASIPLYVFYTLPVLLLRAVQHVRLLYPIGMLFVFLACLDFAIVGYQTRMTLQTMFDRHSFHLIALFLSIGLNLMFFGFILEMMGRIRRRVDRLEH